MFPVYRLIARGLMACFVPCLAAAALSAFSFSPLQAQAADQEANQEVGTAAACDDPSLAMLASPNAPWSGTKLRVLFATDEPLKGELSLIAPDGRVEAIANTQQGGPPYFWIAEVDRPAAGNWQAILTRKTASPDCISVTRKIAVAANPQRGPSSRRGAVWPVERTWTRAQENLYSAWIQTLFEAPLDAEPSWKALHEVLREPSRNLLFNSLALGEDQKGMTIRPDCADLPYFLRAYFAFKQGLPFGYAKCTRGTGKAPQCHQWWSTEREEPRPSPQPVRQTSAGLFGALQPQREPVMRLPPRPAGLVPGFGYYLRITIANGVHSGNGRTATDDNDSDFYPVALTQESLRPGTVYADPYGHILILVKRVPQQGDSAGIFLAVDAQPDGTVARKRFWRGNFLFDTDPSLGGPGFKHFRPIRRDANGRLRRLTNAEIAQDPDYGDFSDAQSKITVEQFYDRMDDVMSPAPLDPVRAQQDAITSFAEQVNARVISVENGRQYQVKGGGRVAMPDGPSIFETTGPWEAYATPARDLRLLIALDVVRHFPERVARRPERYKMPAGKSPEEVKAMLEATLNEELSKRTLTYKRSDGSDWTLTLKDVVDRADALEMAYNINDCVELRWGAPKGSKEAATCKRYAPDSQRRIMAEEYRPWFQTRTRPPRG
ncbi:hypothetical protein V6C03_00420 [Methyloligella sp. 2.7D]|uniref:hypothetical protein n=1 Tax=unclassified Methyloligella TaxID=2625955 RepID=UPI00157DCA4E|nr:hypothetical protein [Methyloligella sp. GL2]QKP76864.1 hypothetical protein HT051_04995 [Methyloligella sp. GL2]